MKNSLHPMIDTKGDTMVKLADVQIPDSRYECGLSLLTGKKIKEVRGYIADSFGSGAVFKLTNIELEDGTKIHVDAEHDYPFLSPYGKNSVPNLDDETLTELYCEENPDECEEDETQ